MKTAIYFDNAATTPIRDEVIEVMTDVLKNNFGNASSSHSFGRSSKSLIAVNIAPEMPLSKFDNPLLFSKGRMPMVYCALSKANCM